MLARMESAIQIDPNGESRPPRLRALVASSRRLIRLVYRDPEHLPERLALKAVEHLGGPSQDWAQAELTRLPAAGPGGLADDLRGHSAGVARVNGAIAGTPFLIAVIPGYLSYLWHELAMTLRTAALYGRDPRDLRAAAETLALRGLHSSVESAQVALDAVRATPLPDKPQSRRSWRVWVHSIRMMLVFGGFLSRPSDSPTPSRGRLLTMAALAAGLAIWVLTWVFPVTLMVAMAWSCEHNTRELGRRAKAYYSGAADTTRAAIRLGRVRSDSGHGLHQVLRPLALLASIAVPVGFVAYADHVRNTTGINWLGALGALVAVSIVIATAVAARSR
jgi:hypothetical protein